jgi:cyanosortase A-associated protein
MKQWHPIRGYILAMTLLGCVGVLGKLVFFSQSRAQNSLLSLTPVFPTFVFPTRIPLREWQFVQSDALMNHVETAPAFVTSVDAQTVSGQHYRYLRNGTPLNIEMRYFVNTYIHVPSILEDSTLTSRKPIYQVDEQSDRGEYALFSKDGMVHRSACITQYGGTSVSDRQLRQQQNTLPVLSKRFFPWFLGQAPLRDLRCMWVNLSIDARAVDEHPQWLDEVWSEWVQWWQNHYPDS